MAKKVPCSSCGKLVWLGSGSLSQPTCQPCRREARLRIQASRPIRVRLSLEERLKRKRERDRQRVRPEKSCVDCGELYSPPGGKSKRCDKCSKRGKNHTPKTRLRFPTKRIRFVYCPWCQRLFTSHDGQKWCSTKCRDKGGWEAKYQRDRSRYLTKAHSRHAKIKLAYVEDVDFIKVYKRDGWVCQLCGEPVSRTPKGSHDPMMASPDHIIPISLGGKHSYENLQCSHLKCNLAKGNRVEELASP